MKKPQTLITLTLLLFFSSVARSEYRVYQYLIKANHKYAMDQQAYTVTSSLDPVSYVAYHGGRDAIKVDLLRSWMCDGHTGDSKSYCNPPMEVLEKGDGAPL